MIVQKLDESQVRQYRDHMVQDLLTFDSSPKEVQAVRAGFPIKQLQLAATNCGLELLDLLATSGLPRSTTHRVFKQERLSPEQSNRVYRVLALFDRALKLFGSPKDTWEWLRGPKSFLQGNSPLSYIDTEPGYRSVEHLLGRLEDGMVT